LLDLLKSKIVPGLSIIAISSFTNDLVVIDNDEYVVLLDDPSLTCNIPDTEKNSFYNKYGIKLIQKASSLTKLLAIKKCPNILESLFSKSTNFSALSFSTMLGILTEKLSDGEIKAGIPADEVRAFGIPHMSNTQLESLLADIGINTDKTSVIKTRYLQGKDAMFYQINDFQAEIITLKMLYKNKVLPKDAVIISLDTVAKIITPDTNLPKQINGFGYDTIRNGGRVTKTWFAKLFSNKYRTRAYYENINKIHSKAAKKYSSPKIYFYPQTNFDENGVIIDSAGNTITLANIDKLLANTKLEDIIIAITLGLGFELRFQCDSLIDNFSSKNMPIYLYGGLTSHDQTGWLTILLETMPKTNIYRLDLPSGAKACAYAAISELNLKETPQIKFETFLLGSGGQRNKEFQLWLQKRTEVSRVI
ncbi:hypothetical protein ACFL1A_03695, partial [Patescibacteria group bacterium]